MSVFMAMMGPGTVDLWTHDAVLATIALDRRERQVIRYHRTRIPGAGDLDGGRNALTDQFLASDAEWLWFVDADMTFPPDILYRLLDNADPDVRPIVGGLCFGQSPSGQHGWGVPTFRQFPTIYSERDGKLKQVHDVPRHTMLQVDGTGAAMLLIHRTVFDKLGDKPWARVIWNGHRYSEDLSFCLRCKAQDVPIWINTAAPTGHAKTTFLDEWSYRHRPSRPNIVVIPVKDRLDLTRDLVGQLEHQPVDRLLIYDNGSTDGTAEWADRHPLTERVSASGWTLHTMWNHGVEQALSTSSESNIFLLNNDITVNDRFVVEMAAGLRDSDYVAVSPNYDNRPRTSRFEDLSGICAGRYDGTGGLSGFAFAVKAEWFANGYRFPETCAWWYGDTDLALSIESQGYEQGMVLDAWCDHVGAATAGDWDDPAWQKKLARDKAAFLKRWPQIQLATA